MLTRPQKNLATWLSMLTIFLIVKNGNSAYFRVGKTAEIDAQKNQVQFERVASKKINKIIKKYYRKKLRRLEIDISFL